MKALTVHNPWAWAIIHAGKDIENRTWTTTYRGPLAIHAGKTWSTAGANNVLVKGALVRIGRPTAWPTYEARGVVLGVVDLVDVVDDHPSPWAMKGHLHWVLTNPRPLRVPLPARGFQQLWDLDVPRLELAG